MKIIKHVPNTLSVMRVILSLFMCVLAWRGYTWWFVGVYFVAAATDFWDGFIARKFKVESALGTQLENIGDACLILGGVASILLTWFFHGLELGRPWWWFAIAIGATVAVVPISGFVALKRFGTFNKIHLLINRAIGLPLFFMVPLFIALNRVPFWVVLTFCLLIVLANVEEIATVLTMEEFNANHNGIIGSKIARKEGRGTKVS